MLDREYAEPQANPSTVSQARLVPWESWNVRMCISTTPTLTADGITHLSLSAAHDFVCPTQWMEQLKELHRPFDFTHANPITLFNFSYFLVSEIFLIGIKSLISLLRIFC